VERVPHVKLRTPNSSRLSAGASVHALGGLAQGILGDGWHHVRMRRQKIFRGWKVVGAGAAIQALHSAFLLQGFQHYAVLLERSFGWSKTTLATAYSLNRVESGLLGPLQGWALGRWGPRRVARTGAVIMGTGFLLFSQTQKIWQFFVFFLVIAIGASLSGFLTVMTATVRWFERKRAKALALSSAGFAIGGAMAPILVWSMGMWGWRWVAAGSGVVLMVAIWLMSSTLEGGPEDHGEHVDGIRPEDLEPGIARAEGVSDDHFTAREAIRTRAFWMISLGHASALFGVGAVLAHLSLLLTSEQGYTLQQASFFAGALPLVQLLGIFIGGSLGDKMNKRLIAGLAMVLHCAGLLSLTYATNNTMIWAFVVLHGLAWGARGPLMQALRADYFGSSSFGQIMGFSSLIVMVGMASGPVVVGSLADTTGSYRSGFTVAAIIAALGTVFFILATPPPRPDRFASAGSSEAGGHGSPGSEAAEEGSLDLGSSEDLTR